MVEKVKKKLWLLPRVAESFNPLHGPCACLHTEWPHVSLRCNFQFSFPPAVLHREWSIAVMSAQNSSTHIIPAAILYDLLVSPENILARPRSTIQYIFEAGEFEIIYFVSNTTSAPCD